MNLQYFVLPISLHFCLILGHNQYEEDVSPECKDVRDAFANASSEFIKCSIQYSRPIKFCEMCVTEYIQTLNSYNNMSQILNNGTPCINSFINLDRLGIIHSLYENSMKLWNRGNCYECFVSENGKHTTNISIETIEFMNYHKDYQDCVTNELNENICENCMNSYVLLQEYYFTINNKNKKDEVCMDIVDKMNLTWTYWGDKCCRMRKHSEYIFITSTVAVLVATVAFYIIAQVYAKKKFPTIIEQTRFLNTLETD